MNQEIKNVLETITKNGYEAYIIGGYPRDYYLGRQTEDYDITTSATPEELKKIFPEVDETDIQYGMVALEQNKKHFEIMTYRKEEHYQDHRFPTEIIYVNTLLEDLQRRDFVMNTLCINQNGEWVDLLEARKDIDHKVIRSVGNAFRKIEEDSLRILRAIRFSVTLDFDLDSELQEAIYKYKKNLRSLSYYRKKEELNRILTGEYIETRISLLKDLALELELIIPEHIYFHTSLLGIWAQLEFSSHYPFSNREKKEIETIRFLLKQEILDPFILYTYGCYYCTIVAQIKGIEKKKILECYQNLPIHHKNELALTPKEIEKIVPKEKISLVIEEIEKEILFGHLENSKVFLRNYIIKKYHGRNE